MIDISPIFANPQTEKPMGNRYVLITKAALTAIILLLGGMALGQKRANIWYFGEYAGIDFNTDPPTALTNSAMNSFEGCASIADSNGNLLFYTDGGTVWNRNHVPMSNGTGLMGHELSTQSAVIVPQPESNSVYYVFTTDYQTRPAGFRYSKVNMSLNGGLGDVEATTKNTLILTPSTEKITATHHANGRDIWVITHSWENANFYAYLVTPAGFVSTPIVSTVGEIHTAGGWAGQLKISPDGKKLACCITDTHIIQLFDFDNQTGIISSPVSLVGWERPYGCEFSPDGTSST